MLYEKVARANNDVYRLLTTEAAASPGACLQSPSENKSKRSQENNQILSRHRSAFSAEDLAMLDICMELLKIEYE